VKGTQASFVAAVAAGGLGKLVPSEWDMWEKLRVVPNTAAAFTGYYIALDALGGDNLGFGPANHYHATGTAVVRNVRLPDDAQHLRCLDTRHLLKSQSIKDWINDYHPKTPPPKDVEFETSSRNILLAADLWWEIKRHWVQELQRFIQSREPSVTGARRDHHRPSEDSAATGPASSTGQQVFPSVISFSNSPECPYSSP
jgi:hypothetical protein